MRKYLILILFLIFVAIPALPVQQRYEHVPRQPILAAAESGNPMAMYALGCAYLKSYNWEHTRSDTVAAIRWLEQAYEAGVDSAAVPLLEIAKKDNDNEMRFKYATRGELAKCYLYGFGTPSNPAEALKIYENDPTCALENTRENYESFSEFHMSMELGTWLLADMLCRRNLSSVSDFPEKELLDAAARNDADAMLDLAIFYGPLSEKGQLWLNKANKEKSQMSNPVMLWTYYKLYLKSSWKKPSKGRAAKCLSKTVELAKSGNRIACLVLAEMNRSNQESFKEIFPNIKDLNMAKRLAWTILATAGIPFYQYQMYYYSYIYDYNPDLKIMWGLKAAEKDGYSADILAYQEYESKGKMDEAVKWYERAADLGYTSALYHLGYMYQYGTDVNPDLEKATRYFMQAVAHPHIIFGQFEKALPSAYRVAIAYETGTYVEQDLEKAFQYFILSALLAGDQSDTYLAALYYKVGEFYDYGKGVEENPGKALYWYNRAKDLSGYKKLSEDVRFHMEKRIEDLGKITKPVSEDGLLYRNPI